MSRTLSLTLSSPLYYKREELSLEGATQKAEKADPGYDTAILFEYSFEEERIAIRRIGSGENFGFTDEEKRAIESGETLQRKAWEDMEIPAGRYLFSQLPYIPEEKDLPLLILPLCKERSGRFYIRLFKESLLEMAVQLLFPSN